MEFTTQFELQSQTTRLAEHAYYSTQHPGTHGSRVSAISVLFGILRLYSDFFFPVLLGEFFHGITIYIPMFLPEIRKNIGI
jgi:hypothetical protein